MATAMGFSGRTATVYAANVDFSRNKPTQPTMVEDGQLLIAATALPNIRVGKITSLDSSIIVAFGPGTIDLSASGSVANVIWTDQAVSATAVVNRGYFCTGLMTLTLPASPTQGQFVYIVADTASAVTIQCATGQKIRIGSGLSSVTGSGVTNAIGDAVNLVFRAADSTWLSQGGSEGTITLS